MNLKIKNFCAKFKLTENQFYGIDKIEGWLDLRSVTVIPKGFNPTVGESLCLSSSITVPKGFNMKYRFR